MANLQAEIPDIEKKNFDINTRANDKNMRQVIMQFVKKFNENPDKVMAYLYSPQTM